MTKTMRVKIHTPDIFASISNEMKTPGITMALLGIQGALTRIAERAIEIEDDKLLEELEAIGIIS